MKTWRKRPTLLAIAWLSLSAGCVPAPTDSAAPEPSGAGGATVGPKPQNPSGAGGGSGGAAPTSGSNGGASGGDGSGGQTVPPSESPKDAGAPSTSEAGTPTPDPRVDATPAPADVSPPESGPVAHRYVKGFSGGGSIAIVDKTGAVEWELPVSERETNDVWLLPSGNVLFAFKTGCREVDPGKKTVWEWKAAAGAETHSCQPLPGERYMVAESRADGSSNLYEMDRAKTISKTVTVKLGGGIHNQLREARKTPEGTYLVTEQRGAGKAREFDGDGKLLRTFPCGRFVAIRIPGGNTLIACGDEHKVIEVDSKDQIVWEVGENEIPGNSLGFVAGLQRLANGNTVICNWAGHSKRTDQPQVFELTKQKKVVWQVKNPKLNMISAIHIVDPEALVDGQALR